MLNSLNVSLTGLKSSQIQMEGIMNNITNENTEGYKKRITNLSEISQVDGRFGRGVRIGETQRVTNFYIFDNLNNEQSKKQYNDGLAQMLDDVESIFHETDDSGLSADLNNLFQSYENFRSNPNSNIYKNEVINHSEQFVLTVKELSDSVKSRSIVTKNTLEDYTQDINSIIKQIGNINDELSNTFNARNDLLDKRDKLENDLSEYVDIAITRSPDYTLKIGNSIVVSLNSNIREIELKTTKTTQTDIYDTGTKSLTAGDKLEFSYNGGLKSISVKEGEVVDGDAVTDSNKYEKLAFKINQEIPELVTAKEVTIDGVKRIDVTSKEAGEDSNFHGQLILHYIKNDASGTEYTNTKTTFEKDINLSKAGGDKTFLSIYEEEVKLKKGKIKPMLENLSTNDPNNKFHKYLTNLDHLVQKMVDNTKEYTVGFDANEDGVIDENDPNEKQIKTLNLFAGGTAKTLSFNQANVENLKQIDLDYLSKIQYKEDIDFDNSGNSKQSFREFYQSVLVEISSDTQNMHFKQEIQDSITSSMQLSYDKITKVDNDEEMMELMKIQSVYEANAKVITSVDQMLKTLLGMIK